MDKIAVSSTALPRHPIRVVAERTGLTPATLRAWERRYGAVEPGRSGGAQRLYSDEDIQRLRLIARLSSIGYALSDLSRSTTTTLARMARQTPTRDPVGDPRAVLQESRAHATINRMLADTRALDPVSLRAALTQSIFTLGPMTALDTVVSPFLSQIGIAWACREASVAQEHLASSVVRDVLGGLLQTASQADDAPTFVATTLSEELHEFGAMMSAAVAAIAGWRVLYLGPNLPADEIARIAKESNARVVGLSVVNPQPTRSLRDEFGLLRAKLGKRATIIAGGASANDHRLTMLRSSIELVESRAAFSSLLDRIWTNS